MGYLVLLLTFVFGWFIGMLSMGVCVIRNEWSRLVEERLDGMLAELEVELNKLDVRV